MQRFTLFALALALALVALVLPPRPLEEVAASRADELLDLALPAAPGQSGPAAPLPLWRAVLASPAVERRADGPWLRLGATAADPTIALLSARAAGELLALVPAADGGGRSLGATVLASPAATRTELGTTLRLHGVRMQADAEFFPDIDHHLEARLALARALRALGASDPSLGTFTLAGELDPQPGGADFLVVQHGGTQTLEFSVAKDPATLRRVQRSFLPTPPNDAALRASLVRGLLVRARRDPAFAALRVDGERAPVAGGAAFRFARIGDEENLTCLPLGTPPLSVRRAWTPPRTSAVLFTPARLGALGAAGIALVLAFAVRRNARTPRPAVAPGPAEPGAPVAG